MDRRKKERINFEITSKDVRIVEKDADPIVMKLQDAINLAEDREMDLVELSSKDDVSICKIIDYKKFLYEKKLKEKLQKQNNRKIKVKEIRFTYNTGEADINFKLNHAIEFLKDGNKVKAFVFFSGRESSYVDMGQIILLKFAEALNEYGKVESMPKLEGKRLWLMISPKK